MVSFAGSDGLSVESWGGIPRGVRYQDGALQLWKATKDDRVAYFTAPRTTDEAVLFALAAVLLGMPGPNSIDVLEQFPLTPDDTDLELHRLEA